MPGWSEGALAPHANGQRHKKKEDDTRVGLLGRRGERHTAKANHPTDTRKRKKEIFFCGAGGHNSSFSRRTTTLCSSPHVRLVGGPTRLNNRALSLSHSHLCLEGFFNILFHSFSFIRLLALESCSILAIGGRLFIMIVELRRRLPLFWGASFVYW